VYVYYSGNWWEFGGTSVASPITASLYGLNGSGALCNSGTTSGACNAYSTVFANPTALHDVTSGSNGSCGGSYLCTAMPGYDGPTGLGTPNGVSAY
jgi:subtilase family serine protease